MKYLRIAVFASGHKGKQVISKKKACTGNDVLTLVAAEEVGL